LDAAPLAALLAAVGVAVLMLVWASLVDTAGAIENSGLVPKTSLMLSMPTNSIV
jgi:hypothetical protein